MKNIKKLDETETEFSLTEILNQNKSIRHFKQAVQVNIYHFYIIEEIKEVEYYLELINTLKMAEAHDTIFIYLNTPGGNLNTTIQIIGAMKQSSATVITCLEGEVCSAGTMIFLSGNKYIINPHCTFMIHNYSDLLEGKGNEISVRVKYTENYFKKLTHNIYGKFLTTDEIESVLGGRDIWMDSDEVSKRLKKNVVDTDTNDIEKLINDLPNLFNNYKIEKAPKSKTRKLKPEKK